MTMLAINTEFVFESEFKGSVNSATVCEAFDGVDKPQSGCVFFSEPVLLKKTELHCAAQFDTVVKVGGITIPVIDYSDRSRIELEYWDEFGCQYDDELTTAECEFAVCSAATACDDLAWWKRDEDDVEDPEYDGTGCHMLIVTGRFKIRIPAVVIAVNMSRSDWKIDAASLAIKYYNDMCLGGLLRSPAKFEEDFTRGLNTVVHWEKSSNE